MMKIPTYVFDLDRLRELESIIRSVGSVPPLS
jgi:hypothetical protein